MRTVRTLQQVRDRLRAAYFAQQCQRAFHHLILFRIQIHRSPPAQHADQQGNHCRPLLQDLVDNAGVHLHGFLNLLKQPVPPQTLSDLRRLVFTEFMQCSGHQGELLRWRRTGYKLFNPRKPPQLRLCQCFPDFRLHRQLAQTQLHQSLR